MRAHLERIYLALIFLLLYAPIAALIVEPLVQGASGMVCYDPSYLARAR